MSKEKNMAERVVQTCWFNIGVERRHTFRYDLLRVERISTVGIWTQNILHLTCAEST